MKLYKIALGAGAALGLAAVASAGSPADYFQKMDANADGQVTEAEFITYKTASGKVTAAEASEKFAKYAGDDRVLTLAELETTMKASQRDKKDCNKDKERSA